MSSEKKNNDYLLEVEHLKQYFPVHQGFSTIPLKAVDDISFAIRPGETLGLVGESGCGKTTVGRTLLRLYQPTAGKITFDGKVLFDSGEQYDENGKMIVDANGKPVMGKKVDVNMMPYRKEMQMVFQDPYSSLNPRMTVEDIIGEPLDVHKLYRNRKERREKILDLMELVGLNAEHAMRYAHEFSGGQQTKIAFIKLLLSKPDILLLDEPTNHLDITTIEWLETYLKNYPKAVVVVSHDRMFLDNVVDVVYEIEYGTATRYPGNYSNFMERKKENYNKMMKDYNAQQKEIARLQRIVDRFKNKPTKVSMAHSKEKAIEHMVKLEAPDRFDTRTFHANFQPDKETGNDVLLVTNLAIGYDHPLSTVSFDLKKGEKLGILGGNGLGKSTLLKTLVGQLAPLAGEYNFGTNVQIGYFDQQMAMYSSRKTVLDDFWDEFPNLTETEARNALGAFMFTGEDVFKNIDMLSGGEKVRLALCKILKRRPNVLVLDEPTNHMDIVGKETLESMLKDFSGTLIFVSHDRYFLDSVAGRIIEIDRGKIYSHETNYSGYLELKMQREEMAQASEKKRLNILRNELAWVQRGARARSTKQKARLQRFEELKNVKGPVTDGKVELTSAFLSKDFVEAVSPVDTHHTHHWEVDTHA